MTPPRTLPTMKCPACHAIGDVVLNHAKVGPGDIGSPVRCVAYCCAQCGAILGVESDPLTRDQQIQELKMACTAIQKLVQEQQRKQSAAALARMSQKEE